MILSRLQKISHTSNTQRPKRVCANDFSAVLIVSETRERIVLSMEACILKAFDVASQ
ncbi:hypothetical protein IMCC1989_2121 [gamma proteobacterium IMCC1989]|nr:hypothetical protein IMCC1989_2121 [gamma proteobacterium IMCC1989]